MCRPFTFWGISGLEDSRRGFLESVGLRFQVRFKSAMEERAATV